ncbi:transcription factor grauzone-like [Toxorhynchites rutilus septentrionalis]|uniref:transcription factor grauzone-like n=1 Tax=Toxorhynchites rutilus septentrionalis TaxID=329112 RepID=UPI00247AB077|nr:transcription factor grauzone-like [Toxorhynchites rutilus septentrionalis]
MNMAETCGLCLCPSSDDSQRTKDDDELWRRIDKIFYFQVVRNEDSPCLVCAACKETVDEFYVYAEQVLKNQQFLRSSFVATTSTLSIEAVQSLGEMNTDEEIIKQELFIKGEPDDTEWVGVDTYCETTIEMDKSSDDTHSVPSENDADTKDDCDWTPNDGDEIGDEDEEEEEDVDSVGSDSDGAEDDNDDYVVDDDDCDEEYLEEKSPKRKYNQGKSITPCKKPKPIKTDSKISKPANMPPIDELILQQYKLSCDLCTEPLEDFTELRKHYKFVHNEQGYLKCCNKKIFKKCWMVEHIQLHLNPDAFHCDICNKSYSSSKVLKEHTKEVHSPNENRPFKCETCLKPFVSHAHLNAHIMVAHGSVPCPKCPKVLASQGSLKKHLVAMHGDGEQYVCDVCARVFRSKQCFDTHVKGHLGTRLENKVQCSVCSVWLTDKYCLTKHIRRMHVQPDVALACELCGKQVRNQDALNCHMRRTHTESRFECDICHKKFKRPHHMREHVAIHHTGEDLYGCNHCPERFNTKNKQYMHRKTAHPVEWEEEMRKRIMKDP